MIFYRRWALALVMSSCLAGCATVEPVALADLADAGLVVAEPLTIDEDATASGLFMAGTSAIRDGRAGQAAQYFERAAQIAPEDDRAFLREQAFTAAVMGGDIERAARVAPTETDVGTYRLGRLVLAVDSLARNEGQAAYDILSGDNLGAGYREAADLLRPWAALAAGNVEGATAQRFAVDNPQQLFAVLNQAVVLESSGRPKEAGPIYAALTNRAAGVADIVLAHGAYLERQGMRREAVALYDAYLADETRDGAISQARARASSRRGSPPPLPTPQEGAAQALLLAAKVSLSQRNLASGVAYLRLSLRLDPDRGEALMLLGRYLSSSEDMTAAREVYERVPDTAPEYLASQASVIAALQQEGDQQGALRRAQALVQQAPRNPGLQVLLADVMRTAEDYAGATKVLTKVIDQRGESADWSLYYARAINRHMANDWPGAEKDLLRARALAPDEPEVMNYLGYSWADRGERLDEALTLVKRAAGMRPNSGTIIDSLGWAYFKVGDFENAVENLERAVELEPAQADINDHLGDVYAAVGRTLEARFQWQRVLTLEADDEMKARVQLKIDAMPEPAPIVAASLAPATAAP